MLPRRRRTTGRKVHARDVVPPSVDDAVILAELVRQARTALEPLAACELDCGYMELTRAHKKIGAENGVGVHIRVASVRLDSDGHIGPEEFGRFMRELDEVRESLVNCFSTMLISMALLLTILVVLFLAKVSYGNEIGASGLNPNASAWDVDAIAWLCAQSSGGEMSVRRVFLGVESLLLALCIMGCLAGVFLAQCNLIIISALPGNMAMLEYLLRGGLKPILNWM